MFNYIQYNLGELETNTYLVFNDQSKTAYLIDPADDADFLSQEVSSRNLLLNGIILTHGHFDHCLVAADLNLVFSCPIIANTEDLFLFKEISKSASYWLRHTTRALSVSKINIDLKTINSFKFDNEDVVIIHTPGHTPGSVCLYMPSQKWLFSGDVLFKEGIGRIDFSYSNPMDMIKSTEKLFELPSDTVVLSGHGQPTTIGAEKLFAFKNSQISH